MNSIGTIEPFSSVIAPSCGATGAAFASARLFHPWKDEKSPAFQASRSPGALRSQSGRTSLVTVRRSCQRSIADGRPQNQ